MPAPALAGEREQLVEPEAAVATSARVGGLAARIALDERLDDGAAELLAEIERHVGKSERVTRLPGCDHSFRRAAGPLRVGPFGIEPEPERDSDRLWTGAKECHGAVDATAHRDSDPLGIRVRPEDLRERICERVRGERLSGDGSSLEQRQAGERTRKARRVGVHDPVAVDREPHKGELLPRAESPTTSSMRTSLATKARHEPARGASDPSGVCATEIRFRGFRSSDGKNSTLPMFPPADANLAYQVGAVPDVSG